MNPLPSIFLSHGAPDLPIREGAVVRFLRSFNDTVSTALGQPLPKPAAILMISAHWHSETPTVSLAPQPQTIHDFYGFPESLYQLHYAAPGAPWLGDRVTTLLTQSGIPCTTHPTRGLDHGAWTPLLLAYPAADIPVTQLSIQHHQNPLHHCQIGQALEPLRHEGVLIIGSGSVTHNLQAFSPSDEAPPPDWVQQFDEWMAEAIAQSNWEALINYRTLAPYAQRNHPTEEHLLPLFVALGAGGISQGIQLHHSYTYGAFSMAAYAFI